LSVYELIGYPLTDSMEQGLSSEAGSHSAIQEIPHLLWNQKFITAFTRAHHWSLSWTRCIQATPSNPISLQSVLYFPLPKLFQRNCPSLRPFVTFCNKLDFMVKSCWLFAQPPSCRTTSYHLSVTTYGYPPYLESDLVYPQPEDVPCHGDGPTWSTKEKIIFSKTIDFMHWGGYVIHSTQLQYFSELSGRDHECFCSPELHLTA